MAGGGGGETYPLISSFHEFSIHTCVSRIRQRIYTLNKGKIRKKK